MRLRGGGGGMRARHAVSSDGNIPAVTRKYFEIWNTSIFFMETNEPFQ